MMMKKVKGSVPATPKIKSVDLPENGSPAPAGWARSSSPAPSERSMARRIFSPLLRLDPGKARGTPVKGILKKGGSSSGSSGYYSDTSALRAASRSSSQTSESSYSYERIRPFTPVNPHRRGSASPVIVAPAPKPAFPSRGWGSIPVQLGAYAKTPPYEPTPENFTAYIPPQPPMMPAKKVQPSPQPMMTSPGARSRKHSFDSVCTTTSGSNKSHHDLKPRAMSVVPIRQERADLIPDLLMHDQIPQYLTFNVGICIATNNVRSCRGRGYYTRSMLDHPVVPAGTEPLTEMVMKCVAWHSSRKGDRLPWVVIVQRPKGIKMYDLFEEIFKIFNEKLTKEEKESIKPGDIDLCDKAFQERCEEGPYLPEYERRQGWRRVDMLKGTHHFRGLVWDPKRSYWVLNLVPKQYFGRH